MSRHQTIVTLVAVTLLSTTFVRAGTERIYIPEGSADTIRVVSSETGDQIARITGVDAVHGLAGSSNSPYLIAGSYVEVDRNDMAGMAKPTAIGQDEHEAHHAKPKEKFGPADAGISLLSVIDAKTGALVRKIEVPGAVHHVAISPDGRFAVSTHPNGDGISVVDLGSFELVAWIPTGAMPNYAVFGTAPGIAYVSNAGNGTISEVDLTRAIVRRNMVAGETPEHMVLDATAERLYVADSDAGRVVEMSLAAGRETRVFDIGGEIHGLDLSDDRGRLYVAGKGTDRLISVNLASGDIDARPLAPAPYHLTTVPGTGLVYVSSRDEPKVWVVDADTLTATKEISIEGEGHQMVATRQ